MSEPEITVSEPSRTAVVSQPVSPAYPAVDAQLLAAFELQSLHFATVMDNISQGLCLFGSDRRLILSNRRYAEIYGLAIDQVHPGMTLHDILTLRIEKGSVPDMETLDYIAWTQEQPTAFSANGTVVHLRNGRIVSVRYQPMPDGGYVATHEDITERHQAEAKMVFLAHHDALTQLPNRLLFQERLHQTAELARGGKGFALVCLSLDQFKVLNDSLGHSVGDRLLQAVGERLKTCVQGVDTVARLGGDEFAIVRTGVGRREDAALLVDRVIQGLDRPFDVDGHKVVVRASVGVALAVDGCTSAERLLKNANIALTLAKVDGGHSVRFFEPEMDTRIQLRREQELDLRSAIDRDELQIYYQPIINLKTSRIAAFEALLRWNHPLRGLITPGDFIPLAEETELIVAIGAWVLHTACLDAMSWPADIRLAVNLSPIQFKRGEVVKVVKEALDRATFSPIRLELEVTESVLLQDTSRVLDALHQLREMGITIGLDDFGTGYSSLSYLRTFPFNKIKIDQGFVRDLPTNNGAMSIIRAVTSLGRELHMTTVAEGVETLEQLNKLREEGCAEAQGYLFSRPRPASEIPSLIRAFHDSGKRPTWMTA